MALPKQISDTYVAILREELMPAMGCTEPIAIAYAAAILRDVLGEEPEMISLGLSGNIIKNVKSVVVPATGGMHGIEAAVAAGIVSGDPSLKLALLTKLTEAHVPRIREVRQNTAINVREAGGSCAFRILMEGVAGGRRAAVELAEHHTNVVAVLLDGKDLTARYLSEKKLDDVHEADRALLTVQDIVAFADEVDLEPLEELLERQIEMNMAIAEEGLRGEYGAAIGKTLLAANEKTPKNKAKAYAAAGSDARMSGCELPVCILSGSGNQGITASVPVVVYGQELGVDRERMLRALLVSDLITVHQKTGIGCLSAYCGAISAGCGCATGIAYLQGGGLYEIAHTLVNAVAILSGTICDGAKPSCAAKIAMAVEAGLMGYEMVRAGHQFYGGDGIVTKGVENTIRNVGRLARDGMGETDREIIRIMLGN